jgi:hypothetical protein
MSYDGQATQTTGPVKFVVTGSVQEEASFRLWTWENPFPGLEIRSLDFVSEQTDSAPLLFAITAE